MYSDKEKCALSREQRSDKIRLANFVKFKVKGHIFSSLAFVLRKNVGYKECPFRGLK